MFEEAMTQRVPDVEVMALSCSNCQFAADVEELGLTVSRDYLHDNTWTHRDCGGQISFATQEPRMTLATLSLIMDRLKANAPVVTGFSSQVMDQLDCNALATTPVVPQEGDTQ